MVLSLTSVGSESDFSWVGSESESDLSWMRSESESDLPAIDKCDNCNCGGCSELKQIEFNLTGID